MMALGDRLLLARILLKALDAEELDEEQCERLFGLGPSAAIEAPTTYIQGPTLAPDIETDLASVDRRERAEAMNEIPDQALALAPLEPIQSGQNLLDDPEDFVQKVARRRSRQMGR